MELTASDGETRSKKFRGGAKFEDVFNSYVFDRKLRVLLLEAIERIEIHIRSRWTFHMVHAYGPHAHLDHKLYNGGLNHAEQLLRLARSVDRSEETFILHYKNKYTDPFSPPLWAATELMTFGELSKWFKATKDNSIKSAVARDLGLPAKEIAEGVFQALSYVRNICAHHSRLWNRKLVIKIPWVKRFKDDLQSEVGVQRNQPEKSVYNVIVVILHILGTQNTDTTFPTRLRELLDSVDGNTQSSMGFPADWYDRPVFKLNVSNITTKISTAEGVHLA